MTEEEIDKLAMEQVLEKEVHREETLHKTVAVSGFLFALMILPVAQYLLNNGKASTETGKVAGVSTDTTIIQQDVAQDQNVVIDCAANKEKELADLQTFYDGKKAALLNEYNKDVEPYRSAEGLLTGTTQYVTENKAALEKLIDDRYQTYLTDLTKVQTAVDGSKAEIQAKSCQ